MAVGEIEKMAERVRSACLEAALAAYEEAGIHGLCAAGRWEYALQAISTLDLQSLLAQPIPESLDRPATEERTSD
ncbi:MAG: acetyltransferase [Gammaproteobacteria bacterium]|nr:acetyltransferase [Gammaproteobacteria bacterium]MCP5425268.1 acetyltransferase [Gammaproteobacteria bacterium]